MVCRHFQAQRQPDAGARWIDATLLRSHRSHVNDPIVGAAATAERRVATRGYGSNVQDDVSAGWAQLRRPLVIRG